VGGARGQGKAVGHSKREVWEAFKRVKANQGAAGVHGQSIAELEADLSNNLYKLWNCLFSGSSYPQSAALGLIAAADLTKADQRVENH
jgi:retron-type reverse transcriptase